MKLMPPKYDVGPFCTVAACIGGQFAIGLFFALQLWLADLQPSARLLYTLMVFWTGYSGRETVAVSQRMHARSAKAYA